MSKIYIKNNEILKNRTFNDVDIYNELDIKNVIFELKNDYEDYWKNLNKINTSIRLSLNIRVNNFENLNLSQFEKNLEKIDLIYKFNISKFDEDFTYYQIVFNGTPNDFLKTMKNFGYDFNTQSKIWILK